MNEQSQKPFNLKDWLFWHMGTIFIFGVIGFSGFLLVSNIDKIIDWSERFEAIQEKQIDKAKYNKIIREILRYETNCLKLQNAILDMLSGGANADSWLPDINDEVLKIGKQRFEVLGCNK